MTDREKGWYRAEMFIASLADRCWQGIFFVLKAWYLEGKGFKSLIYPKTGKMK
ncbi:MAG: hypothetical protein IJ794_04410 [Lachnospiraceae bacterium]|nr:hypothetical protein [Lachnospiraceae bacterium]